MRIHILSIFTEMFQGPLSESMIKRASEKGLVKIHIHDIRNYTHDKHHTTDDYPYGGGPGMVMKPEPIFEAVEAIKESDPLDSSVGSQDMPIILLSPQGQTFTQAMARELAKKDGLVLLCGHYEGVDERVREHLATCEISIGDYVLTGGELAAMVVVDAVVRLIPGVLGSEESGGLDTFSSGLLQFPQYTRPPEYRGWSVPEILLSGDHAKVARWRRQQSLLHTFRTRPDLLKTTQLSDEDRRFLDSLKNE